MPFTGDKTSWHGFDRYDLQIDTKTLELAPFLPAPTDKSSVTNPLNALQKSYRPSTGPRTLAIRLRMPHGHGDAGEAPPEVFTFADSILKHGDPLDRVTGQGRDGAQVWATVAGTHPLAKVELNWTKDSGPWPKRLWESQPATLYATNRVSATLPDGVTVYYLNIFDDRECVVSTEHEEMPSR